MTMPPGQVSGGRGPRRVTTRGWDVAGMEAGRMLRQYLVWRLFRFGSLARGPGLGRLVELNVRTRFGHWLSRLTNRYERQWLAILSRVRGLRRRGRAIGHRLRRRTSA